MSGPDLGILTVNLSPDWLGSLNHARIKLIEKRLWSAFMAYLAHYGIVAAGARAYWHPCGDKCKACGASTSNHPLSLGDVGYCSDCGAMAKPQPHVNFLVPLLGISRCGNLQKIPRKLQIERLRGIMGHALDSLSSLLGLPSAAPNLWWGFRVDDVKKRHSMAYFARPFPGFHRALKEVYGTGRRHGLAADTRSARAKRWRLAIRPTKRGGDFDHVECPECGKHGTMSVVGAYYGPVRLVRSPRGALMVETLSRDHWAHRYYLMSM